MDEYTEEEQAEYVEKKIATFGIALMGFGGAVMSFIYLAFSVFWILTPTILVAGGLTWAALGLLVLHFSRTMPDAKTVFAGRDSHGE